jgi:hypothetical protein
VYIEGDENHRGGWEAKGEDVEEDGGEIEPLRKGLEAVAIPGASGGINRGWLGRRLAGVARLYSSPNGVYDGSPGLEFKARRWPERDCGLGFG